MEKIYISSFNDWFLDGHKDKKGFTVAFFMIAHGCKNTTPVVMQGHPHPEPAAC